MKRQTIKETIAIGFLLIIIISLLVGCDRHGEYADFAKEVLSDAQRTQERFYSADAR